MGKARALKLGIVKGVAKVATKIYENMPAQCPICRYKFNIQQLILDEKESGMSAEVAITRHIKNCMMIQAPHQKIRHRCGQEISISELDDHLRAVHGWKDEDFKT